MTVFTNENLYMNSWLKILQIDISIQLTKKIWGIQYLGPYPGPSSLSSYEKQIPQFNPYNPYKEQCMSVERPSL